MIQRVIAGRQATQDTMILIDVLNNISPAGIHKVLVFADTLLKIEKEKGVNNHD